MFQPSGKHFPRARIESIDSLSLSPTDVPVRCRNQSSRAAPIMGVILATVTIEAAGLFGIALLACRASADSQPASGSGGIVMLTTLLALTMIGTAGGYSPKLILRRPQFLRTGMVGAGVAFAAMSAILQVVETAVVAPLSLLGAGVLALVGVAATRAGVCRILTGDGRRRCAPRTVLVGGGAIAAALLRTTRRQDRTSPRWLGYIDDQQSGDPRIDLDFLGGLPQLLDLIRQSEVDQVIIALPWSARAPLLELIGKLAECPVQIRLAPDSDHVSADRATALIDLAERPLSGWNSLIKRGEDVLVASLALAVFAIPMGIVALAIRLDSPGPALFRQNRTGFNNRDFRMLKFRTMHHHSADLDGSRQAIPDDPRITRIGGFLRRSSLDELPQIFNVLVGDMSIVGPRPHAPGTRAGGRKFNEVVVDYASRHRVRPGLTGLAQVRGLRGPTDTEERLARRVDSDLEYIEHWSVWLDLIVLLRTAVAVVRMTNAH